MSTVLLRRANQHLLGIETLSALDIRQILARARILRDAPEQVHGVMAGVPVITLFYESSTRTRVSFEMAAQKLGASTISISASSSSVTKGESLWDTGRTLASMDPGVIIIRHSSPGAPQLLAEAMESVGNGAAVVNAGDGAHEHPTQALLDALTLLDRLDSLEGRTIGIIGDIAHSRVARSNLFLLRKLGARVLLGGPRSLVPKTLEPLGARIVRDVDEIIEVADAVMMLRVQFERMQGPPAFPSLSDYTRTYGLTAARARRMPPQAFVMHPGPMNRGIEIDPEVADGPTSVVAHQVRNGVAARMAVLERAMDVDGWSSSKDL